MVADVAEPKHVDSLDVFYLCYIISIGGLDSYLYFLHVSI